MLEYFVRRVLGTLPVLFGVALLIFALFNLVGGDPAHQMVGRYATPERLAEVRREHGLDRPLPAQFAEYLRQVATFDYGRSFKSQRKISDMILEGVGPSLTLVLPAFAVATCLAILIALLAAYHRGTWLDRAIVAGCVLGMSVSILAYILFGQYFLAYRLGWFPVSGWEPGWPDRLAYVALPGLLFAVLSVGYDVRFYRTALLDEIGQDYVRTARAKGLAESAVFLRHVLRNGLVPIITHVLTELPLLILALFLLEGFFGIPGLGRITLQAIQDSDSPVLRAMATLQALLLIAANLLTDLLYAWADPRVRLR